MICCTAIEDSKSVLVLLADFSDLAYFSILDLAPEYSDILCATGVISPVY